MPRSSGSTTKCDQGPSMEPGNSSTRVVVHSGGLSQFSRNSFSSLAAAAISIFCCSLVQETETFRSKSSAYNGNRSRARAPVCPVREPKLHESASAKRRRNNRRLSRTRRCRRLVDTTGSSTRKDSEFRDARRCKKTKSSAQCCTHAGTSFSVKPPVRRRCSRLFLSR